MTINELKQIPIETLKEDLSNSSNIVAEYMEYMLEHRRDVTLTAVLQEEIKKLQS